MKAFSKQNNFLNSKYATKKNNNEINESNDKKKLKLISEKKLKEKFGSSKWNFRKEE